MIPDQTSAQSSAGQDAFVSATETFFLDIANNSDAALKKAVAVINGRRRLIRIYEATLIPDREQELEALRQCWAARDIPRLKALIYDYYQRRHALAPQIVSLINASGSAQ